MDPNNAVKRGINAILPKVDATIMKEGETPDFPAEELEKGKVYVRTVQFMLRLREDLRDNIKLEALMSKKDMNKYLLDIIMRRHELPQ